MPITDTQRARRQKRIGSSDMGAIMGFDPHRNAADVYWSKVNNLEDVEVGDAGNLGNFLEDGMMRWAANELGGRRIIRNQYRVKGILAANCDALFADYPEGIEAKTTGWYNGRFEGEEWGEPGSDQVPSRVLFQAQHQMYAADLERVWVPSLISGRGATLYKVERRDDLIEQMVEIAERFWDFVEAEVAPPNMTPSIETLKRVSREEGKVVELDDELWDEYVRLGTAKSEAEKAYKEIQTQILHLLGDAEEGRCSHGGGVTYYLGKGRRSCDFDRLLLEFPEAYEACVSATPTRSLRKKNPPKEK